MKKSVVMALAGGMSLGIASVASAGINFGNFSVGNQFNHVVSMQLSGLAVTGLDFSGDLVGMSASAGNHDLLITIQAPSGNIYQYGGYIGPGGTGGALPPGHNWPHPVGCCGPGNVGSFSADWSNTMANENQNGTWTFTFTYDWAGGTTEFMDWQNVTINLHKIPAPGALALLGVAGLVGTRRRRN